MHWYDYHTAQMHSIHSSQDTNIKPFGGFLIIKNNHNEKNEFYQNYYVFIIWVDLKFRKQKKKLDRFQLIAVLKVKTNYNRKLSGFVNLF